MEEDPTASDRVLREYLSALGISGQEISSFVLREQVVYDLRTETNRGVAIIQIDGGCLAHGIVSIKDPGGGVRTFGRFRELTFEIARHLSCIEIELYGAAVINAKLDRILERRGFGQRVVSCPQRLGNIDMEIRYRRYPLGS